MAPECYSSNLRARQVHGVDLKTTSEPRQAPVVLACAQEHWWDSLRHSLCSVPALPAFTSTGCQRVFGGWRAMRRAVPCSSAENIQPKGQVSVKHCWNLGCAAGCPSGSAVQRCHHLSALAQPLLQPSSQELFPEHSPTSPAPLWGLFLPSSLLARMCRVGGCWWCSGDLSHSWKVMIPLS